ncbi:alpha/beta hydrolase, partial [Streptomyces sp. NPDC014676]
MNSTARRRSLSRRTVIATGVAGAVAAAAFLATHPAAATGTAHHPRPAAGKPTVVLVHGAFADSSSWNGVIKNLQREGYPV